AAMPPWPCLLPIFGCGQATPSYGRQPMPFFFRKVGYNSSGFSPERKTQVAGMGCHLSTSADLVAASFADPGSTNGENSMGGLIPLSDASRRPVNTPVVTILIIIVNVCMFVLELVHGEPFVMRWSAIPADIVSSHHWLTILTAMFMHGGWSHIIGNMVFLWAFGPEIEDAMGPLRYLVFYLAGGVVAMAAQVAASPHSTVPNLGASGAIAAVMGAFLV